MAITISTRPSLNTYSDEKIIEYFSVALQLGGLIAFREMDDGTLWVEPYRHDGMVVVAAPPSSLPRSVAEEDRAYDGSNEPQKRHLTARERDILCRMISLVARDERYAQEEIERLLDIREILDPRRG